MVKLFGEKYTKKELLTKVGDISQIANAVQYELQDGNEKGVDMVQFNTGSGFSFNVAFSRGMDITHASQNGIPLCWRSSTGDVSPAFYEPEGLGWLRSFYGGLVTTCGMTYAGAPCEDDGKQLGLHGRVSNILTKNIQVDSYWEKDEYYLFAKGKLRETTVFGENIQLTREIKTQLGKSKLWIYDTVENLGYQKTEHMYLYHINIGFPVVDAGSELISPTVKAVPRDKEAEIGKQDYNKFSSPVPGYKEKVYYHTMKPDSKGNVTAAIVNKQFNNNKGIGIYVKYPVKHLPYFVEWKMMGQGTYVVGMEPANCKVEGRAKFRKEGLLQFLEPGEKREYKLEIGVLENGLVF